MNFPMSGFAADGIHRPQWAGKSGELYTTRWIARGMIIDLVCAVDNAREMTRFYNSFPNLQLTMPYTNQINMSILHAFIFKTYTLYNHIKCIGSIL